MSLPVRVQLDSAGSPQTRAFSDAESSAFLPRRSNDENKSLECEFRGSMDRAQTDTSSSSEQN